MASNQLIFNCAQGQWRFVRLFAINLDTHQKNFQKT